jgi:hypothetical protein
VVSSNGPQPWPNGEGVNEGGTRLQGRVVHGATCSQLLATEAVGGARLMGRPFLAIGATGEARPIGRPSACPSCKGGLYLWCQPSVPYPALF